MFFIYGWGNRQKTIANGSFPCPVCRTRADYTQYSQRRWFSFFFVPLFPISSPQEFVGCHQCQNIFNVDTLPASHGIRPAGVSISGLALGSMLVSFLALLSFCVFFVSLPLSIAAVVMGHLGYRAVQKNQPHLDGMWQAVTGLVIGYSAMFLSAAVGAFFLIGPQLFTRDGGGEDSIASFAERSKGIHSDVGPFSPKRALAAAETMIAAKQDLPAGRGNNPEAIALASSFATRMKRASDEAFTSSRKPLVQLSGGEYLTFCELHEDRCLFLVHVPSYRNFTGDAKKVLAEIAWVNAQMIVAGKLPARSRLAVGLRGTILYGDIMLGNCPASEDELSDSEAGEKDDLLSFFIEEIPVQDSSSPRKSEPDGNEIVSDPFQTGDGVMTGDENPFGESNAEVNGKSIDSKAEEKESTPFAANSGDVPSSKTDVGRDRPAPEPELDVPTFVNKIPVKLITTIKNEAWGFASLAFSHDRKWLACGKMDASVFIYDAATGNKLFSKENLQGHSQMNSIAFSHDNRHLVAGAYSGATFSWEVDERGEMSAVEIVDVFRTEIKSLIASPKFDYFAIGNTEGRVAWLPFRDAQGKVRELKELKDKTLAVWLPEKGIEALATDGKAVLKFSLKDGSLIDSTVLDIKYPQMAVFSQDGEQLLVTDFDKMHVLDVATQSKVVTIPKPRGEQLFSLEFHPNKRWVATGFRGRTAIWDLESSEIIAYAQSDSIFYDKLVCFSDDGKSLAVASDTPQQPIRIYEIDGATP
jgi:hypothetical protein